MRRVNRSIANTRPALSRGLWRATDLSGQVYETVARDGDNLLGSRQLRHGEADGLHKSSTLCQVCHWFLKGIFNKRIWSCSNINYGSMFNIIFIKKAHHKWVASCNDVFLGQLSPACASDRPTRQSKRRGWRRRRSWRRRKWWTRCGLFFPSYTSLSFFVQNFDRVLIFFFFVLNTIIKMDDWANKNRLNSPHNIISFWH